MVISSRIAYLRRLIEFGAKATICKSTNKNTGACKFKVIVDPSTSLPASLQTFALASLDLPSAGRDTHCVAARGHRHSKSSGGISEVVYYITQVRSDSDLKANATGYMNTEVVNASSLNPSAEPFAPLAADSSAASCEKHKLDISDFITPATVVVERAPHFGGCNVGASSVFPPLMRRRCLLPR